MTERWQAKGASDSNRGRRRRRAGSGIYLLEPRMMYDGAAAVTVDHAVDHSTTNTAHTDTTSHTTDAATTAAPAATTTAKTTTATTTASTEASHTSTTVADASATGHPDLHSGDTVVFVDSQIDNYQAIVNAMKPDAKVIVYDGTKDGLHEIAQDLQGAHDLASVDIISHGAVDQVRLGTTVLTTDNMADHAADLAAIGNSLAANGQIDLYGCDVAAGGDGFLDALKTATGHDVAASTDATGATALGGNWTLEATTGPDPLALPADMAALQGYNDLLVTATAPIHVVDNSTAYFWNGNNGVPIDGNVNGPLAVNSVTINDSATDSSGDLFIVGDFRGKVYFGQNSGGTDVFLYSEDGRHYTSAGTSTPSGSGIYSSAFIVKYDSAGVVQWAKELTGTTNAPGAYSHQLDGNSIAVSSDGTKVVVGGSYTDTSDLDPGTGTVNVSNTYFDAGYVVELDGSGNYLWNIHLTGSNDVTNIALDSSNNVYASGDFDTRATNQIHNSDASTTALSGNSGSSYFFKADAAGVVQWVDSISNLGQTETSTALAVDGSGHVYAAGTFSHANFAGTEKTATYNSAYLVQANTSDGSIGWVDAIKTTDSYFTSANQINDIALSSTGPVVTGSFGNGAQLDPHSSAAQTGLQVQSSYAATRAFVEQFDYSGNSQWIATESANGYSSDVGQHIVIDGAGNVVVGGQLQAGTTGLVTPSSVATTATFGTTTVAQSAHNTAFYYDTEAFVWNLSSAGATVFAGVMPATDGSDVGGLVPVTSTGGVSLALNIDGTVDADPSSSVTTTVGSASLDGGALTGLTSADLGEVPPNHAPVASFTANPNPAAPTSSISFDGSGSSDPDGDSLTYSWDFGDGTNATGANVAHTFSQFGSYTVKLTVTDPGGLHSSSTVTENINQGDHPPVADAGGPYTVQSGASMTLDGTGSSDPDTAYGDSITSYAWDFGNDGSYEFTGATPTISAATLATLLAPGSNTIALKVTDSLGETSTTTTTVYLNQPPFTFGDSVSTNEDTPVTITGATLLANDGDPNGNSLTIVSVQNAQHGTVQLNGGDPIFTPDADYNGQGSFTYTVSDGHGGTADGGVTVHIAAVNDAPAVTVPGAQTVNEDTSLSITGLSVSDVDANGGTETVSLSVSHGTLAFGSTSGLATSGVGTANVTLSGTIASLNTALAGLSYKGDLNYNGSDTLNVSINDAGHSGSGGALTDTQAVAITVNSVNDAPVVTAGGTLSYTENDAPTAIDSGLTVSDVDSANLHSATVQITGNYANGQDVLAFTDTANITGSFDASTGTLTLTGTDTVANYQAALESATYHDTSDNPSGLARTITWQANDGSAANNLSTAVTSTIDVTPVNDAPVAANSAASFLALPNTTLDLKNAGFSVSDVDGNSGTETVTLSVTEGTLAVTAGGSGASVSHSGTSAVTIEGTIDQINALLNTDGTSTVSYIDSAATPGTSATLTLAINDNGHTGAGTALTGSVNTTITVDAAPVLANAGSTVGYTERQTTPSTVTLEPGITLTDADAPVTGNDINGATVTISSGYVSGDVLTADVTGTSITQSYDAGTHTLTLSGADTLADYQHVLESVTFASTSHNPTNYGASTSRTISWSANDIHNVGSNTAATTVDVTAVNDPAVLSSDTRNLTETNSAADISSSGTLTISDVDSPATFVAQSATVGNYGTFAIGTGGAWTYTASSAHNEFAAGQTYTDTFDVVSADGTHTSVTINIAGTNDAAVVSGTSTGSVTEAGGVDNGTSGTPTASGTLTDVDVDNPDNTFTAVSTAAASDHSYGTYTVGADGAWTFTLDNSNASVQALNVGQTLTDTFTVHTVDGTAQQVTVTINGANDAPVISTGGVSSLDYNAASGQPVAVDPTITLSDVDGTTLAGATVKIASGFDSQDSLHFTDQNGITGSYDATTGALTLTGTASVADYQTALASITFQSTSQATGTRVITLEANDGGSNGTSAAATVDVNVSGTVAATYPQHNGAAGPGPIDTSFTPTDLGDQGGPGGTEALPGPNGNFVDFNNSVAGIYFVQTKVTNGDVTGSIGPDHGHLFTAQVPLADLEAPLSGGNAVSIFASEANGDSLPVWLHFDPATGLFSGEIPADAAGKLNLEVIARDGSGHESVVVFTVDLTTGKIVWNGPPRHIYADKEALPAHAEHRAAADHHRADATKRAAERGWQVHTGRTEVAAGSDSSAPTAPAGRIGLSQQLRSAGSHAMHAQRMALLESVRQQAMLGPH